MRAHRHVVVVDDLLRDVAIGEHGIERHADLAHAIGHGVALHAKMQVPIEVEVAFEVRPHQRLSDIAVVKKLVE